METLQSNFSQHLQVTHKYGTITIIFSCVKIKTLHRAISNDCSRCFNTGIYFQAKTCFSKSGMWDVAFVMTHNQSTCSKLLQMSPGLKTECLVNCLRRNKFITNKSSDSQQSRLLWASPLILSLRIFPQFHFRLGHFIFGSYLRPSLIVPLFFPKASSSNILAVSWENRYSQFLPGQDL